MKAAVIILLFVFSTIECRKIVPINKHANVDFINMESGGHGYQPAPAPTPVPAKPIQPQPTQPKAPTSPITTAKPVPVAIPVAQPLKPSQPRPNQGINQGPSKNQMDLKPVQQGKPGSTVTTPGPGSVKQLVTFYDSQGKASVIRPYSYSDAVKKGKA